MDNLIDIDQSIAICKKHDVRKGHSRATIEKLCKEKVLKSEKKGGRDKGKWLVDIDSLKDYYSINDRSDNHNQDQNVIDKNLVFTDNSTDKIIDILNSQLEKKDYQLQIKDLQIERLYKLLENQQVLTKEAKSMNKTIDNVSIKNKKLSILQSIKEVFRLGSNGSSNNG